MEIEQLLTGSRWELLRLIAHKPQSTSQLADQLGTSQPNVSQQLKQLEIAGFVRRIRSQNSGIHYVYEIPKETLHLTYLAPRTALKKTLRIDPMQRFLAALQLHQFSIPLLTFVLGRPELVTRLRAIGVLKRNKPELLVIADSVDDIRREHANIDLKTVEGPAKVALWSHTEQELREGLDRADHYFTELLSHVELMYDPHGVLLGLKEVGEK